MPAGAEAIRAERRIAREATPERFAAEPAPGATLPGGVVVRSAVIGTIVYVVVSLLAVVVPSARIAVVVVDLGLFLAGCGLYFWGWAVAAGRSRESQISLLNLISLQDVAPNAVRARLLGALGVQVAVAAATCWITEALAFGWLVPVWGLAHCEYWGARHGVFGPLDHSGMGRQGSR
jgi:hypothetical protein